MLRLRRYFRNSPSQTITLFHQKQYSQETTTDYEDVLQLKKIKDPKFYDEQGKKRNYFYYIDLQGRLFLEDTVPKNITSSLKANKFLIFFFRNVRKICEMREKPYDGAIFDDYQFLSKCGKEKNFINAGDTPIVFNEISSDGTSLLYCNGQFSVEFEKSALKINKKNGRLYHPLGKHKYLDKNMPCLISSHLAISFSNHLIEDNGNIFYEYRKGERYLIESIG